MKDKHDSNATTPGSRSACRTLPKGWAVGTGNKYPSREELPQELAVVSQGNLCRCGTTPSFITAAHQADPRCRLEETRETNARLATTGLSYLV